MESLSLLITSSLVLLVSLSFIVDEHVITLFYQFVGFLNQHQNMQNFFQSFFLIIFFLFEEN